MGLERLRTCARQEKKGEGKREREREGKRKMHGIRTVLVAAATWNLATAHTVITYPGWRGNNLHTTGALPETNPDSIGIDYNNSTGEVEFPYGMQWMYPCKRSDIYSRSTVFSKQKTSIWKRTDRLTTPPNNNSQAVDFPKQKTEPNGPSEEEHYPCNPVGFPGTKKLSSM